MFQTPSIPASAGRFDSHGADRKCWSISAAPARKALKFSAPIAMASESPIDDQIE